MKQVISRYATAIAFDQVGEGPAVILVDGAMAHRGFMGGRPLAAALSQRFTAIAYDRRGRGGSGDVAPYAVGREIDDIEALAEAVDRPVCLYGASSGAVLALKAAAALGDAVAGLALYEPPCGTGDLEAAREAFARYSGAMNELLAANRRDDAVALFLADMVPPEALEEMRGAPEWRSMVAVAHTLAYDNAVMGDGTLPVREARGTRTPTLILDGGESMAFMREAADELAAIMPNARRQTLGGQTHGPTPEAVAPVLSSFFAARAIVARTPSPNMPVR